MEQSGKSSSRSRFNLFNWDWDTSGKTSRSKSKSRDDRTSAVGSPSREHGKLSQSRQQELLPYREGTLATRVDSSTDQRPPPHRSAPIPPPRSVSKTSGQKLISSREGNAGTTSMYNVRQHQHDLDHRRDTNDPYANDAKEEPLVAQKITVVRKAELAPVRKKSGVDWEAPKKIIAVNENEAVPTKKYNQESTNSQNFAQRNIGQGQKPSMQSLNTVQLSSESSGDSPLMQARVRQNRNGEEERLKEVVWRKEAIGSQIKREAQRARTVGRRAGVETASLVNSHTDLRSGARDGPRDANQHHNQSRMARQEKPVPAGSASQSAPRDRGTYRPQINLDDRRLFPSRDSANFTFESAVLALIRLRRLQARLIRNRDRYVKELELFRGWNDERYLHVLDQIAKSNNQMDELEPLIASLEAFIREQQTPSLISEHDVIRYPVNGNFGTSTVNGFYKSNDYGQPSESYQQPAYDEHSDDEYMRDLREILAHSQEPHLPLPPVESRRKGREPEAVPRKSSQNMSKSIGRSGMKLKSFDSYDNEEETIRENVPPTSNSLAAELDNLKEKVRQLQVEKELLEREQNRENQRRRRDEDSDQDTVRERNDNGRAGSDGRSHTRGHQQPTTAVTSRPTAVTNGAPVRAASIDQRGTNAGRFDERQVQGSGEGSVDSGSEEVSVDDPSYQYADFSKEKDGVVQTFDHGLNESLYKMQEIMSELDTQPPKNSAAQNFEKLFAGQQSYNVNSQYSSGHPPLPPTHKLKPRANSMANRHRRHHTISAGDRRGLLHSASKLHDGYDTDSNGNSAMSSRKSSLDDEEISYDFQIRLNSPEQIYIPERYLDEEPEVKEDPVSVNRRLVKTESIRRMLAAPGPGSTDKDQKDREKVLLMTPVLAREATERSRRLALQSKQRSLV